ncbi:hypothetical protein UFOVP1130_98 [uncultured Caudovirales phage]|uniref:Uncharacterized protein n=1 Tax=uncultured Caudovirales phage TaxID=2100421 RepID=A0A6J5QWC0_9CAUD|nr:hypothetical protein UFOVP1130_98 [uncultured Caudovirales phage]
MADLNKTHADATIKGAAIGLLAYVAAKYNVAPEAVALAIPLVAAGLSFLSTKIGDKNTALLLSVATKAIAAAPAAKAPAKKTPAKKTK